MSPGLQVPQRGSENIPGKTNHGKSCHWHVQWISVHVVMILIYTIVQPSTSQACANQNNIGSCVFSCCIPTVQVSLFIRCFIHRSDFEICKYRDLISKVVLVTHPRLWTVLLLSLSQYDVHFFHVSYLIHFFLFWTLIWPGVPLLFLMKQTRWQCTGSVKTLVRIYIALGRVDRQEDSVAASFHL